MNHASRPISADNTGAGKAVARAEYPPEHYWTRWPEPDPRAAAAAPASEPATPAPAPAAIPEPAAPPPQAPSVVRIPLPDAPAPEPVRAAAVADAPHRVLIVEDDRSQGLFAQTILRGAGIVSDVVSEATEVISAMRQLKPDLVLMDLHLERLTGIDLTTMIRSEPSFANIPIVFITGDPDPERQFEVLEQGADDYLSKPVRPRLLIASVQNRIKRARALQKERSDTALRSSQTGLHQRQYVIDCINQALTHGSGGGLQLIEVQDAPALKQRYGYAALEHLMNEAGRCLGQLAGEYPITRLNDEAFLAFVPEASEPQLRGLSSVLRNGLAETVLEAGAITHRLQTAIGYAMLGNGYATAGHAIDAGEQALRNARQSPSGVAGHVPDQRDAGEGVLDQPLREALRNDSLELLFQPIVAVTGGEEAQFQVLLRMRDAQEHLYQARDVIPAAQSAGLMAEVDRWVVRQAIEQLARHPQKLTRLFVSQSPATLADDHHADWLLDSLQRAGVPATGLVVDLRFADAQAHSVALRRFCERMRDAGVQICLSAYRHSEQAQTLLEQLPLGYVRLSPDYSRTQGRSGMRDEIRMAIEQLHRRGLKAIGQQLEDPQEAALLWISGIDYIQGNLVQPPGSALDFDFQNAVL